jgi:aspartate racemase
VPKHIGIVAASPEGSAFCYRRVGRRASEIPDPARRPSITLHNRPFSTFVEHLREGDWSSIATLLADSAHALHLAGAEFCILPDNALHHAVPLAEPNSPIPWLSMIDLVADAVHRDGCRTLGMIGTRFVTYGSTYQTALGLRGMKLLVPDDEDVEGINTIIFREAVLGAVRQESRTRVLDAIAKLADRGCDALILGCSEATLLMSPEESPLPVVDPVELLAEAAVRYAVTEIPARERA